MIIFPYSRSVGHFERLRHGASKPTALIVSRSNLTVVFSAYGWFCFYLVSNVHKNAGKLPTRGPRQTSSAPRILLFDDPARTCLVVRPANRVGRGVGRRSRRRRFARRQRSVGPTSFNTAGSRSGASCVGACDECFVSRRLGTYRRYARERRDDDHGRGRAYCPETTRLRVITGHAVSDVTRRGNIINIFNKKKRIQTPSPIRFFFSLPTRPIAVRNDSRPRDLSLPLYSTGAAPVNRGKGRSFPQSTHSQV